ncbi:MAG: hypothetical protein HY056_12325 [Proteobacteria bacterium]|nr:hypothetical protein [Pseudomonadota bacterium]
MDASMAWQRQQNSGVRTFRDFQQRVSALAAGGDHAALYSLLAALAARFVAAWDGRPLPVGVAQGALASLTLSLERARRVAESPDLDQLAFLNEIARTDLA